MAWQSFDDFLNQNPELRVRPEEGPPAPPGAPKKGTPPRPMPPKKPSIIPEIGDPIVGISSPAENAPSKRRGKNRGGRSSRGGRKPSAHLGVNSSPIDRNNFVAEDEVYDLPAGRNSWMSSSVEPMKPKTAAERAGEEVAVNNTKPRKKRDRPSKNRGSRSRGSRPTPHISESMVEYDYGFRVYPYSHGDPYQIRDPYQIANLGAPGIAHSREDVLNRLNADIIVSGGEDAFTDFHPNEIVPQAQQNILNRKFAVGRRRDYDIGKGKAIRGVSEWKETKVTIARKIAEIKKEIRNAPPARANQLRGLLEDYERQMANMTEDQLVRRIYPHGRFETTKSSFMPLYPNRAEFVADTTLVSPADRQRFHELDRLKDDVGVEADGLKAYRGLIKDHIKELEDELTEAGPLRAQTIKANIESLKKELNKPARIVNPLAFETKTPALQLPEPAYVSRLKSIEEKIVANQAGQAAITQNQTVKLVNNTVQSMPTSSGKMSSKLAQRIGEDTVRAASVIHSSKFGAAAVGVGAMAAVFGFASAGRQKRNFEQEMQSRSR